MAGAALGTAYRQIRDLLSGGSTLGLEDGELLERFRASNDPAAFEALVARHGPMVLATCRAVLRNEHDAEDAFQATFLVLSRKAGSVRGGEALGGWLHRVAYRASVQASKAARKRRRLEVETSAMASPPDFSASVPVMDPELRPILHAEVDRLPDRHRLPVVLCDLEGLTYEQAAERLRWTLPTLRCRLAKARQRLRARLTRRGFTPSVAGPILAAKASTAIVPPALARATVLAATGGLPPAGAALIAQALLKGMLMTKLKIAGTAALATLALASAGLIAAGAGRPEPPAPVATTPPEVAPKPRPRASRLDTPTAKKPVELVEVKGRVVSSDGQPVAGAVVLGFYLDRETSPFPKAESGPDGRFSIRLPNPKAKDSSGYSARFPWLVATAPGHGLGWTEKVLLGDRMAEREVRLTAEGPPIEGRILDLEGRAVAGAKVEVARLWYPEKGDLAEWVTKARNGGAVNLWQGLENLPLDPVMAPLWNAPRERLAPLAATSDADGRFKLTGVGRGRIAELFLSGPNIATTEAEVFSLPEAELRLKDTGRMSAEQVVVHAPRFQVAVQPGRRVAGVARDADTGKPIAGIEIKAAVYDENSLISAPGIQARTDAEGRYALDGLPLAEDYRLFLTPDRGLPYTKAILKAPAESRAIGPVAFDFILKRGIVLRGKVTDKVTGRPVRGYPSYYTFRDNPHLKDYPGFEESYESYENFRDDGSYELVALPGRGLVSVRAEQDRHKAASGMETIAGYDPKQSLFSTVPRPVFFRGSNIIAEVNLDPKAETATLDMQADPGLSVALEVVDPDGQPLGGTKVKGKAELFPTSPFDEESATVEIHALDPAKPRRVVVTHESRKLIGSIYLKGTETGPITLKLQPWGTVAGRIVDDEGRPRKSMFIGSDFGSTNKLPETHDILPWSDWNQGIRVTDDGRFRVEGLVPGLKYSANTRGGYMDPGGLLFRDIVTTPGGVTDLGDLKASPIPPNKEE
jgi:RNA polymerase sigma factor (sigma-70 family)